MRKVELQILAQDILISDFTTPQDCAITRALVRAGINARHDGYNIVQGYNPKIINTSSIKDLTEKVLDMYHHESTEYYKAELTGGPIFKRENPIKPQDFTYKLELKD